MRRRKRKSPLRAQVRALRAVVAGLLAEREALKKKLARWGRPKNATRTARAADASGQQSLPIE